MGFFVFLFDACEAVELCLNGVVFDFLEEERNLAEHLSLGQEVHVTQVLPVDFRHAEHLTEFGRREGQERLESDGEVGGDLEREVQDGCGACEVGFSQFPGLGVGKVFVADTCEVHSLLLCIAEAESVQQVFHLAAGTFELVECGAVVVIEFAALGNVSLEIFLGEYERAVDEVAVDGDQFVVVACLEVRPSEVVIFCLGSVGREDITQYVLFAGEIIEVFVEPNRPVARGRNLVALEVEELVGGNVVGQDV